jgi:uncharacterized membrane protein HdeD (DUF308 family)
MIRVISKYWWILTLRGLIATAFGLAVLLWPALTLRDMVFLFGSFVLLDAGLTLFTAIVKVNDTGRWPLLFEGGVGSAVCVTVLVYSNIGSMLWPRIAAAMLVYYIAAWAILTGLFKMITSFRLRKEINGEWILGLCGVASILAGVILIFRADSGVLAAAWLIGVFAIILGILLIFFGLKFRGMHQR